MKYFVYFLYSKQKDRYYIGQTYDLEIRKLRHLIGTTKFTKQASDWELVYKEDYGTRAEAVRRERLIKSQKSRKYLEKLIFIKRALREPGG